MTALAWITGGLALLLAVGVIGLWLTGRFARLRHGAPAQTIPPGLGAPLDTLCAPPAPGLSGARLITSGPEALALRLAMTRLASRSLDLMYYIWEDDLTGRLLAEAILAAADRGVRVRLLLDDVNVLGHDPIYRTLDRHPHVQVRIFNPVRIRKRGLLRGVDILLSFLPYNRRMHGKLWLTDSRLALTGGRNLGDAYFGAPSGRGAIYDDLDLLVCGAVIEPMTTLFDRFWNSEVALPIRALWPQRSERLSRLRARLARRLTEPVAQTRLAALALPAPALDTRTLDLTALHWGAGLRFVGDPPEKSLGHARDGWLPGALMPLMQQTHRQFRLMTPYFVPGQQGMADLIALRKRGVGVEVLTNGLAVSDNLLVQGAYRWYRTRLLAQGVRLFERAPDTGPRRMLHAKALLIDDATGFVGSFNFDLRSAFLNTELGLVIDEPALLAELRASFDAACAPDRAWALRQDGRAVRWLRGALITGIEPDSTAARRALSWLVGHLPIHRLL